MIFKFLNRLLLANMFLFLVACGDTENEKNLVDLHAVASLDIISISFIIDDAETTQSINSEFDFQLQGLMTNGVDTVAISSDAQWSVSEGALSKVDQSGHFTAGETAEVITITAQVGHLSQSIQITISAAKFDKVVQLSSESFNVDMCRAQILKPIARYVDESGNEEVRPVDSTVINTIEWIVKDQENTEISQRAHIETSSNQASLHTLAAGNIAIQAIAASLFSGNEITSDEFIQTINNGLSNIKLCDLADTDLSNCQVDNERVEQNKAQSLIAVGTYQATDGSDLNENISRNAKWGVSDSSNASIALATDKLSLEVTGILEDTSVVLSVACGDIVESLEGVDLSQGVTLNNSIISCSSSTDCFSSSTPMSIDKLSVDSLDVSANDTDLTSDESITLGARPDEIILTVTANFSDSTSEDVTEEGSLVYSIITTDGQSAVVEEDTDTVGVFKVLREGTAKIQLDFRGRIFVVLIVVP
jgi:hypothetical protein